MLAFALAFALHDLGLSENGDLDEGVHLLVARLLNSGHSFDTIFYDQFALLPQFIAFAFRVGGDNLLSARLAILLSSAFGLLGLAALAQKLNGRLAAIAVIPLTITHSFYLQVSRYTIGEAPALACVIWAFVLLLLYRETRQRAWLAIAAAFFCAAVLFKPLVIGFTPTLLLLGLSVHVRRAGWLWRVNWHGIFADALLSIVVTIFTAAPFVNLLNLEGEFQRTAGFHFTQSSAYTESFEVHFNALWSWLYVSRAWLGFAVLGIVTRLRANFFLTTLLVLSECITAWMLIQLPPFPHHYALLVPMVSLFAACGLHDGMAAVFQFAQAVRSKEKVSLATMLTAIVFVGALVWGMTRLNTSIRDIAYVFGERWLDRKPMVNFLRKNTSDDAYILSDDPKIIYLANRNVPPSAVLMLYDTTFDILPDALARFQKSAGQYNVQAIVVTGPYRHHDKLLDWIQHAYPLDTPRGDGDTSVYGNVYQPAP